MVHLKLYNTYNYHDNSSDSFPVTKRVRRALYVKVALSDNYYLIYILIY